MARKKKKKLTKKQKALLNARRRETYKFYRSLGFDSKTANKMKNRTPKRVAADYKDAQNEYNNFRFAKYAEEFEYEYDYAPKPYRPVFETTSQEEKSFSQEIYISYDIPFGIAEQMGQSDLLQQDIYQRRLEGLKNSFEMRGKSWDEFLSEIESFDDLGEWLDAADEFYSED